MKKSLLLAALFCSFWSAAQTFSNNDSILISDAGKGSIYPSEIQVAGLQPFLREFTVHFNIEHSVSFAEIDLLLEAPNGQRLVLISDLDIAGLKSFSFVGIGHFSQPKPDPLDFQDLNPNGTWRLFVVDDEANGSETVLNFGWWIDLEASDLPACKRPDPLEVLAITDSSVTLNWSAGALGLKIQAEKTRRFFCKRAKS